jgi:hypothetical protein
MYLVEEVELLVYNRMTGRHEKGHRQVEGLHSTHNAYNICNSLVIKLCTNTTLEGFGSAALSSRNDGNHSLPISIYLPPGEIHDISYLRKNQVWGKIREPIKKAKTKKPYTNTDGKSQLGLLFL